MRLREIKKRVALGADGFGERVDKRMCFELLDTFVQLGGEIVDTALLYCDDGSRNRALSERIIGEWLNSSGADRKKLYISTKGGHPNVGTMHISRLSEAELSEDISRSLEHLRTDCIDMYWLHRDDIKRPVGEIAETLNSFVKRGYTREIGLSNWSSARVEEFNAYAAEHDLCPAAAVQIHYNIAKPNIEAMDKTLALMNAAEYESYAAKNMPVMAFASQAKGFFAKLKQDGGVDGLDEKTAARYFNSKNAELCKIAAGYAERLSVNANQLALSVLSSDRRLLTFPIIGSKNIIQLRDSMAGIELELPQEIVNELLNFALNIRK